MQSQPFYTSSPTKSFLQVNKSIIQILRIIIFIIVLFYSTVGCDEHSISKNFIMVHTVEEMATIIQVFFENQDNAKGTAEPKWCTWFRYWVKMCGASQEAKSFWKVSIWSVVGNPYTISRTVSRQQRTSQTSFSRISQTLNPFIPSPGEAQLKMSSARSIFSRTRNMNPQKNGFHS